MNGHTGMMRTPAAPTLRASPVLQLATHRRVTFVSSNGIRTLSNIRKLRIDNAAWRDTTVASRPAPSMTRTGRTRDDYLPNPAREVMAIGLRILGSFAVVLTLAGGLAYLLVRAMA